MDKKEKQKKWDWLPAAMPGVAKLIADKRRDLGADHVNECWRRGVVECEPGWFFAREAGLAVGVPWADFADVIAWQAKPSAVLLILRDLAVPHGA